MLPAGTTPRWKLISLTGFMGCGKTTVGGLLARHLAWHFVDLDTRIEQRAGLRITEIFARLGEPAFREIEHEQLVRALGEAAEQDRSTVLALGGGTFAQPPNVELLRSFGANRSVIIWLDCPIEQLLARSATLTNRPLFRDEASFRQLFTQRLPFYQQADYRVESNAEPPCVVEQILSLGIADGSSFFPELSPGKAFPNDEGRN